MVRRASGGWCPVIDLKQLNHHIDAPHFHMHTISSVLSTVERGDYAFKIDLQDAYFHLLIHPDSRKYLRFAFENKVYQFRVLPFGLNTAPQVFTHLGHTVAAYLHRQGTSVILPSVSVTKHTEHGRPRVKQSKIRTRTSSGYPVSGALITFGSGESFPPSIQSLGDNGTRMPNILPENLVVHRSVPIYGIPQQGPQVSFHRVLYN